MPHIPPAPAKPWLHWPKQSKTYGPLISVKALGQTIIIASSLSIVPDLPGRKALLGNIIPGQLRLRLQVMRLGIWTGHGALLISHPRVTGSLHSSHVTGPAIQQHRDRDSAVLVQRDLNDHSTYCG
ncbi:uncharacterized protein PV06_00219 [Exophiala oligosperma]|uniref:Uncharacterized protein n=1 Tax=Exophiala oligosperma TaxID=215243 RepID=A0A0D2CC97_9EURO|nr:uncharacterized protein PV06_00219 [Exophiala oligosperma]KIW47527.1 hypothetical protein PV06_00219 [Exophiala oligosperma]